MAGVGFKASAKKHWSERKGGLYGPVPVPEWPDEDGQPAQIYTKPLTAQERFKVRNLLANDSKTSDAEILLTVACDADGKRIWNGAERTDLATNYDPQVVGAVSLDLLRLLGEMSEEEPDEEDSVAKES